MQVMQLRNKHQNYDRITIYLNLDFMFSICSYKINAQANYFEDEMEKPHEECKQNSRNSRGGKYEMLSLLLFRSCRLLFLLMVNANSK